MRRATMIAGGIAVVAGLWILSGQFGGDDVLSVNGTEAAVNDTQPQPSEEELPRVRVIDSVAITHVQEIAVFGRTEADKVVDVRAETAGRVVEILAEEGSETEEGTALVRLAMDDRQAKLTDALAQVRPAHQFVVTWLAVLHGLQAFDHGLHRRCHQRQWISRDLIADVLEFFG